MFDKVTVTAICRKFINNGKQLFVVIIHLYNDMA